MAIPRMMVATAAIMSHWLSPSELMFDLFGGEALLSELGSVVSMLVTMATCSVVAVGSGRVAVLVAETAVTSEVEVGGNFVTTLECVTVTSGKTVGIVMPITKAKHDGPVLPPTLFADWQWQLRIQHNLH